MRKLYGHPLSGHSHKARMLLSFLGLPYEDITVDVVAGAQHEPAFRALNPKGTVPVLVDDDVTIYDSHAILVYLARKYGGEDWLPITPVEMAKVTQWLSYSANEIHHGLNLARLNFLLGLDLPNIEVLQDGAKKSLALLDAHLSSRQWLELDHPTIADVACFPYVALGREAQVPLDDYGNVLSWVARVKALPKFVSMAGL